MKETRYVEATRDSGRALVSRKVAGELVTLSLLRFRAIADYSAAPEPAPSSPISGAKAFQRYIGRLPVTAARAGAGSESKARSITMAPGAAKLIA